MITTFPRNGTNLGYAKVLPSPNTSDSKEELAATSSNAECSNENKLLGIRALKTA